VKKFLIVGLLGGAVLAVLFSGDTPLAESGVGQGGGFVSGNGDVNGDGGLDLSDAIYLLTHLFQGGPAPEPCPGAAGAGGGVVSGNGDVNGDNGLDLSDAIYLLTHLFQGGPASEPCPEAGGEAACSDGIDDDGDGYTDCDDSDCYQGVNCPANEDCDDNIDNDGDGATDCADWDCSNTDLSCTPLPLLGFTYEGKNTEGYHEWTHNHTGLRMVQLPGGLFNMGSQHENPAGPNYDAFSGVARLPAPMPGDPSNESPVHRVTLSPFLICKTEVTQDEYVALTGTNPSNPLEFGGEMIYIGGDLPVNSLRWDHLHDVRGNPLERSLLQLPTEAQWEYACRAGTTTPTSAGNIEEDLESVAWMSQNSDIGGARVPHPVGTKPANAFGLHDMHGNAYEYVQDHWLEDFYSQLEAILPDPLATVVAPSGARFTCEGPAPCVIRRGGSFERPAFPYPCCNSKFESRSAFRGGGVEAALVTSPDQHAHKYGIRLALTLPTGPGPEFDCTDGADDDGDDDTDCDDIDCFADAGCSLQETNCGDDLDNDGDGLVDCDDCDCNCTPDAIAGFTDAGCNAQGYREWTHDQTGMTLVMLAGTGHIGGQSADPWNWNYDPVSGRFLQLDKVDPEPDQTRLDTRNDGPVHKVTLSPYLIGKYEVTQGEYKSVAGFANANPSYFRNDASIGKTDCYDPPNDAVHLDTDCDDRPVEAGGPPAAGGAAVLRWIGFYNVDDDNVRTGWLDDTNLHFPTEAQWEYACRGGQPSGRYSGDGPNGTAYLDDVGWHAGNSFTGTPATTIPDPPPNPSVYVQRHNGKETHNVGTKAPNAFGIHDMHGNVMEWVRDTYGHGDFYASAAAAGNDPRHIGVPACKNDEPPCPTQSPYPFFAIWRGGNFGIDNNGTGSRINARTAARQNTGPGNGVNDERVGFRAAFYPIPGR